MPILIPICAFTFMGYYFADKYTLFRFYSLPPMLDSALADSVSNILPYAVLLHLLIGMWMMSNEEFFRAVDINLTGNFGNTTSIGSLDINTDVNSFISDDR